MAAAKQTQAEYKGVMSTGRATIVQSFEMVQMGVSILHRSFSLADNELKNLQTIQHVRLVQEQAILKDTCSTLGIEMPQF